MLAATAVAQTQSQSHRCKSLEQSVAECQTIWVTTSAAGGALNLLSRFYPIVPIEKTAAGVFRTQSKWMNLHDGNKKETTYLIQQVTAG